MVVIARKQSQQMGGQRRLLSVNEELVRELDRKVLGTLPSVEHVHECMVRLLKESEREESPAYLMCYWVWFGADLGFPKTLTIDAVNRNASQVAQLLWARAVKRLNTKVVVYDPTLASNSLRRFMKAVLKYNAWTAEGSGAHVDGNIREEDVEKLLGRYTEDFKRFEEECKGGAVVELRGTEQISAIMFAKEGEQPGAVLFMLETDALEGKATGGGFLSRDRRMVEVVKSQITAAAQGRSL
jgi:hypothetical protein